MSSDIVSPDDSLTFGSKSFDASKYQEVARKARLQEVRLIESNYQVKPSLIMSLSGDTEVSQSFFGAPADHAFSVETGVVAGAYRWAAEIKTGRTKVLKISAQYFVVYAGLHEVDEEYAQLYFKKLSRFTSYPYFRSHFAIHTSASSIVVAPLPSLTERVD